MRRGYVYRQVAERDVVVSICLYSSSTQIIMYGSLGGWLPPPPPRSGGCAVALLVCSCKVGVAHLPGWLLDAERGKYRPHVGKTPLTEIFELYCASTRLIRAMQMAPPERCLAESGDVAGLVSSIRDEK